jgi:hypothetical protein
MFIPKECEPTRDGFKENVEQIRQLWSQKMDDHTINRLAKTELFLSENVHHLEIQIETAMLMLEALTVAGGVATISLFLALRFVRQHSSLISRLTMMDRLLPVKIAYTLDLELQKYFSIIGDHEGEMSTLSPSDAGFAENQLQTWLYGIEMNRIPNVILPPELGGEDFGPRGRQASMGSDEEDYQNPRAKKAKVIYSVS